MSEPYLGQLMCVGFNFNNRGWANCDGQLLPISQNQALFSLFGTMYGGDGRTTFGLPGLRGRVPIHAGTGPGLPTFRQGAKGGATTETLNITQIPSHNHSPTLHAEGDVANSRNPNGRMLATPPSATDIDIYISPADATDNVTMSSQAIVSSNMGGSQSHNNMQPYQVLRWLVALVGVFPSRN